MRTRTIDTPNARRLVEASVITGAAIVGQPGGWSVTLRIGAQDTPLGTQRDDRPRTWRSLDSCVEYLRSELHIVRIDGIDASNYSVSAGQRTREDAAARMKAAHEALSHAEWLQQKVEAARAGLDDGSNQRIEPDQWEAIRAAKRRQLDSP